MRIVKGGAGVRIAWLGLLGLVACGDDDAPADAAIDAPTLDVATTDTGTDAVVDVAVDALAPPVVLLPRTGLDAADLGVIVNDADPLSVEIGEAYRSARNLDASQVFTVTLPDSGAVLSADDFNAVRDALEPQLVAADIQALALAWTEPYRVDCMSITSAFALGFDSMWCNTTGGACGPTANAGYFNSASTRPFDDHALRPAMALTATTLADAQELIDRGVAADDTFPDGDGYLVRTTDAIRSVRADGFGAVVDQWDHAGGLNLSFIDNGDGSGFNGIRDTADVLFYFTGLTFVPDLETNTYLPGAVADHLTSFGGRVPTSSQMSIIEWLRVGVTASYGTVVEPCNSQLKFPSVPILLERYFRGETLIEAYWKSVRTPGEGLFVGEPLARPFGAQIVTLGDTIRIETNAVVPGEDWVVEAGDSEEGPWRTVASPMADEWRRQIIEFTGEGDPFYRLRRMD